MDNDELQSLAAPEAGGDDGGGTTAPVTAPSTEPAEPAEHVASTDQLYKDYFGPPSSTPWPLPGSTPPWLNPAPLGPDPSTLGQPSATPVFTPPSTAAPVVVPGAGGGGALAPTADHAPAAATSALPAAPNLGGMKLPPWISSNGAGGNVGGQNVAGSPKFSTTGNHDLGNLPVGDTRNPTPQ